MKKQKLQAGIYLYRGYTIQRECMIENDVYPPSTVRWEIVRDGCCEGVSATLKRAMIDVDQLCENESQDRFQKTMTKMANDYPSIRQMFKDLGYATK